MFVCLSVCLSVRKIIDFCEADMEGASRLLDTGTLRLRFSRIQKWMPLNEDKKYQEHIGGLFWGPVLGSFLRKGGKVYRAHARPYQA